MLLFGRPGPCTCQSLVYGALRFLRLQLAVRVSFVVFLLCGCDLSAAALGRGQHFPGCVSNLRHSPQIQQRVHRRIQEHQRQRELCHPRWALDGTEGAECRHDPCGDVTHKQRAVDQEQSHHRSSVRADCQKIVFGDRELGNATERHCAALTQLVLLLEEDQADFHERQRRDDDAERNHRGDEHQVDVRFPQPRRRPQDRQAPDHRQDHGHSPERDYCAVAQAESDGQVFVDAYGGHREQRDDGKVAWEQVEHDPGGALDRGPGGRYVNDKHRLDRHTHPEVGQRQADEQRFGRRPEVRHLPQWQHHQCVAKNRDDREHRVHQRVRHVQGVGAGGVDVWLARQVALAIQWHFVAVRRSVHLDRAFVSIKRSIRPARGKLKVKYKYLASSSSIPRTFFPPQNGSRRATSFPVLAKLKCLKWD